MTVIKIISERRGDHVHQRVFIGPDPDHLALAGSLVMNVGEWQIFGTVLLLGEAHIVARRASQRHPSDILVILEGEREVVEAGIHREHD